MRDCVHESPDGIEEKVSKKHIHSGQCRCFENTVLKTPFYVFVSFVVQEHIINAVRFGLNGHSPAAETTLVSFPESRKQIKKNLLVRLNGCSVISHCLPGHIILTRFFSLSLFLRYISLFLAFVNNCLLQWHALNYPKIVTVNWRAVSRSLSPGNTRLWVPSLGSQHRLGTELPFLGYDNRRWYERGYDWRRWGKEQLLSQTVSCTSHILVSILFH